MNVLRVIFFHTIILIGLTIVSCNNVNEEASPATTIEKDPKITLVNNGTISWEIVEVEGPGISVSYEQPNQSITLKVGLRYTFINLGGASHPLDFRNAENEILLSQDLQLGSYEDDEEVNFVFDFSEDLAAFNLTEKLAAELTSYNCSFHEAMQGKLFIE